MNLKMILKKTLSSFIFILFITALSACGSSSSESGAKTNEVGSGEKDTITVTHELGKVEVERNPEKVVVFDYGILDTFDQLGIEVTGVPQLNLPSYLSKYGEEPYGNVGSLKEPDFEKISEIGPDLIIISGRQAEMYDEFMKIAPTIYMAPNPGNYVKSFKANMEVIGEIFGKEAEVEKELAAIDAKIEKVREKTASLDKKGLIILVNEGKISAYGPGSRFGLIHDVLGVPAADPNIEASTHGQSVSFEYVLEKNPDYLFVIDRTAAVGGEGSAKEMMENELISQTNAYKEHHIIYLNPEYWYLSGGGLLSMKEMISEVEEGLE
jgi:Periplasmic binding protein.